MEKLKLTINTQNSKGIILKSSIDLTPLFCYERKNI